MFKKSYSLKVKEMQFRLLSTTFFSAMLMRPAVMKRLPTPALMDCLKMKGIKRNNEGRKTENVHHSVTV
jgi:hypothetical protein